MIINYVVLCPPDGHCIARQQATHMACITYISAIACITYIYYAHQKDHAMPNAPPAAERAHENTVAITLTGITNDMVSMACTNHACIH